MSILVVEPHADDAFLSLGWHLEKVWAARQRTILTVFADEKRTREAAWYAARIGVQSVVLGLQESKMLSEAPLKVIEELRDYLGQAKKKEPSLRIVMPIGLQHPDHKSVAYSWNAPCYEYLEIPYQGKQKLADEVSKNVEGCMLYSICYPNARKWRHIPIFKSQAKFFHFNPPESLRMPEIVLCPA